MSIAIVIPARYNSTRFPGKPLAEIAGKTMLQRVVEVAQKAAEGIEDISVLVATEDQRIMDHAKKIGAMCVLTSEDCATGSDRVLAALEALKQSPDFIINLQGDAPFTSPSIIKSLIEAYQQNPDLEVVTPIHQLSWDDLDRLRSIKETVPFSGTTTVIDKDGRALWFSKNIIPAIRKEAELRKENELSPICQHIGIYGFRANVLKKFCDLPRGNYELLEGLEQLRLLENGISIQTVTVDASVGIIHTGIDTPEDLARAEEIIKDHEAA